MFISVSLINFSCFFQQHQRFMTKVLKQENILSSAPETSKTSQK